MTLSHRLSGGVRTLAALAVAALVLAFLPLFAGVADAAHPENETQRFRGENRFGTAALIAQQFIDEQPVEVDPDPDPDPDPVQAAVDTVIVATGEEFADALAAASLSGHRNAPIVLVATNPDAIPAETEEFLENNPDLTEAIIVGQTLAVGPAVEARLEADFGLEVTRIGGQNRFETAARIGDFIAAEGGEFGSHDDMTTAILATGERFPDALASGPLAFGGIHPILLSPIAIAEPEALAFIEEHDVEQLVIAGGTRAISAEAEATFRDAGVEIIRVNGPIDTDEDETIIPTSSRAPEGRVSTAVGLAQLTRVILDNEFNHESETGTVARGDDFADALVVAPLVGLRSGDLLLSNAPEPEGASPADFLSGTTVEAVASGCSGYGGVDEPFVIPGGFLAVTEGQEDLIRELIVCDDFVPARSLYFDIDSTLVREWGEAVVAGEDVSFDVIGFAASTPTRETDTVGAEGAEVTWELYAELDPTDPDDADLIADIVAFLEDEDGTVDPPTDEDGEPINFYVEDDGEGNVRYFVLADGPTTQVLDEDGRTMVDLGALDEGDYRLFVCAPPQELPNPGCTDDEGNDRSDAPYGFIRADIAVGAEDPDAQFEFPIESAQEVGAGTPDGDDIASGTMTVSTYVAANVVCYGYAITAHDEDVVLDYTGAHFHDTGTGGIVEHLITPLDGNLAAATCLEDAEAGFADDLTNNPEDYYFNLHTADFPTGLVRGEVTGELTE